MNNLQRRPNRERKENRMLFAPKEKGQGPLEIVLIIALIIVIGIAIWQLFGPYVVDYLGNITLKITPTVIK
jgi:hypothetical protein